MEMQATDLKTAYEAVLQYRQSNAEQIDHKIHFCRLRRVTNHQAYRARKAGQNDRFTAEELHRLFSQAEGICPACGRQAKLTVDHIVPLSGGGSNGVANLQAICARCNFRKGARVIDFRLL
jgi:5-methylcytosine-specific restriction endonuclease McrA